MTRRKQKSRQTVFEPEYSAIAADPKPPLKRGPYRDASYVKSVMLRMGTGYIEQLDYLCKTNNRSRREIVELLIHQAAQNLNEDPNSRINPL